MAKSHELGIALSLLVLFPAVFFLAEHALSELAGFLRYAFGEPMRVEDWSFPRLMAFFGRALLTAARLMLPLLGLALVVGAGAQLAQVGFLLTGEPLRPKLERLNPVNGLKRLFSKRSLVELLKALLKTAVIGAVCYNLVRGSLPMLVQLMLLEPPEALEVVSRLALRIGTNTGALLLALAAADYGYQWYEHNRSLRMSKQELKEEYRQTEGDPLVRSRLRQRQREIARGRSIRDVPKADVVVTNPTHVAVALQYDAPAMEAPVVVAKGAGRLAERIKEIAREHGVAIVENPPLARALYDTVPVGTAIPPELYQAVAEVLAYVWRLRGRTL